MKIKLLLTIILIANSLAQYAQNVQLTEAEGWFESAYIIWEPIENVDSFKVTYSGNGITDQEIDEQLIRNYGTHYRADIPGLAPGEYSFKVMALVNNQAGPGSATGPVTVKAYDRAGFAFSNQRVPGAYKNDGTLKSNAVVLYITENTKNTVSLDVTGATANPCVGLQTILDGFKKGEDNRPLLVRFIGQITTLEYMEKGDLVIDNNNNSSGYITFEGIGDDATADGWGIRIKNASNIEVRNLGFMNTISDEGDDLGLQQNNDYIWVHHCDFFYGGPGGDSDQAKGDGALDCKKSTYVTISYNHFWDTGKSNLLGNGGEDMGYITYHHNWYDHSDSRHPRVREHTVHVYNNYFDGNAKYGIGATTGCSIFAENNYFRNCKYPMLISLQGSDVFGDSDGTFSSDPGGMIKAFGNHIEGAKRFVDQNAFPNDFDAYVVDNKSETVPSTVKTVAGGNTYNNFDTDASVMYNYVAESPEEAITSVTTSAGRILGGDFKWTFNNSVDDVSYDINTALKSALTNYQTSLVSIQGDGNASGTGGGDDNGGSDSANYSIGERAHNFTESGLNSEFYTFIGNLSGSKGTVNYNGMVLTQCLKIESSTDISFTAAEAGELTLVFNETFSGDIKIDGTSFTATSGILIKGIASGDHQITKDETCNLYFMSLVYASDTVDDGGGGNSSGMANMANENIVCYPNPVKELLNIETAAAIQKIELYTITGVKLLSTANFNGSIDLSAYKSGPYIITVHSEQETYRFKVFKE